MVLRWALAFFIVALFAALLGFTGIAVAAYLFFALFVLSLLGHLVRSLGTLLTQFILSSPAVRI